VKRAEVWWTELPPPVGSCPVVILKSKDRDAISAIYDASVKVMTRDGTVEDKVLQTVVEDVQRAANPKKEFRSADFFDFSFLRKAREQLKASGWRP
jgi:hypothetical protein